MTIYSNVHTVTNLTLRKTKYWTGSTLRLVLDVPMLYPESGSEAFGHLSVCLPLLSRLHAPLFPDIFPYQIRLDNLEPIKYEDTARSKVKIVT